MAFSTSVASTMECRHSKPCGFAALVSALEAMLSSSAAPPPPPPPPHVLDIGRPSKLTPHQKREAIARRDAGEAHTAIARTFGVSNTAIGRL